MESESIRQLLIDELSDIYNAETQILDAMPQMLDSASSSQLKKAIQSHMKQTQKQKQRLEKAFSILGESPKDVTCKGMQGIVQEAQEIIEKTDSSTRDVGLISAARKVEHYEMASYMELREHAKALKNKQVEMLLMQTLDEEKDADKKLTQIGRAQLNMKMRVAG
jgi:ferritin-like metal-binding protein YciE